jgi:hypothetical protein
MALIRVKTGGRKVVDRAVNVSCTAFRETEFFTSAGALQYNCIAKLQIKFADVLFMILPLNR